ncbi:hypothetical protein LGK99_11530 [Clostridium algidicarnis]|uniref:hypothetical protein n=1 Tax=Clostridium algidicarnis TaxID=37659 RepID=UPI001CF44EEC|nr:hypothetical protein [Clostridium algidicarnis]MCB2287710.1 hypothetical protein [Clostridium algidicarnis]
MNDNEEMFKQMYKYLLETKNVFGTWNVGGPSKKDNLIIIANRYKVNMTDEEVITAFRVYIQENKLEMLKF